jgi:putative ABC transport system permease protein
MIWLEGFRMALGAIGAHKLRSALTLVGIVAGVAAIIAVMTGVSVIQSQMEAELSVLGSRVFRPRSTRRSVSRTSATGTSARSSAGRR